MIQYTNVEMVETMHSFFKQADKTTQQQFINTPFDELVQYHHSLGQDIRNQFRMWEREWTPELRDGIDYSPCHPDALSMKVIEELWKKVQPNG